MKTGCTPTRGKERVFLFPATMPRPLVCAERRCGAFLCVCVCVCCVVRVLCCARVSHSSVL